MSSALATQPEPAPVAKVSQPRVTNTVLLGAACTVLLLAPLAFGAVEPWSIFALEVCATALLVAWLYRQWINGELSFSDNPIYRPMAAFFALALVQVLAGTTAYRHATYTHLLLYAAYGMLVFVVTQTARRASQFELMANLFTAYGAACGSVCCAAGYLAEWKAVLDLAPPAGWLDLRSVCKSQSLRRLDGNADALPAGTGGYSLHKRQPQDRSGRSGGADGCEYFPFRFPRRHGGVSGTDVGARRSPDSQAAGRLATTLLLGAFLALVIVFLVWLGGNELTRRLASIHSEAREEIGGGVRLTIDRDCLRMFLKRPFLGWGLGTFPIVYPEFRSFYTTFFVNQAHNDYLQMLVETGVAGFSVAVWFLVVVFRGAAGKLENWSDTARGAMTVAALLGCVGILVHSFLDFNLQIPANAALFYVLCALAAGAPLQESQRRRVLRRHNLIVQPGPEAPASRATPEL